ncbi:O-acyltransferase WSD1-like [Senna tora]|uniref:O-acyltransferase WSD1-like n=1 Tax=Senna tora TaxID=362788 RepID=A0A834TJK2_9FABA|nr:O-acyltransferase WSD1-like [Senna tora]
MVRFEEESLTPASPTAQYLNSTALNVCVIAVLESQIPIDDSRAVPLLRTLFLPLNPRFSSIMIEDNRGNKQWKQVEVDIKEHIIVPTFPSDMSLESYDQYVEDYVSRIAGEHLPQNRPLWDLHIIKYPTTNSAGTFVFKLHHSLGDGYSLMGALLSCAQRVDDPSLPLTFPSSKKALKKDSIFRRFSQIVSPIFKSVPDFGWSVLKSTMMKDDETPIRSGDEQLKFRPRTISNVSFSVSTIKQVQQKLGHGVSVNDVLVGLIFLGIRLYMKEMESESSSKAESTALVLLNTRNVRAYKSVNEMVDTKGKTPWGNRFAFLHIPIPKLSDDDRKVISEPLEFVWEAKKMIERTRYSLAVPLTGMLLDVVNKLRGAEVAARYVHDTVKNSSASISNVVGPIEQVSVGNHPLKGLYFLHVGFPESLTITIMSYIENIRVAFGVESGFIDVHKFKSCIQKSLQIILKAASD